MSAAPCKPGVFKIQLLGRDGNKWVFYPILSARHFHVYYQWKDDKVSSAPEGWFHGGRWTWLILSPSFVCNYGKTERQEKILHLIICLMVSQVHLYLHLPPQPLAGRFEAYPRHSVIATAGLQCVCLWKIRSVSKCSCAVLFYKKVKRIYCCLHMPTQCEQGLEDQVLRLLPCCLLTLPPALSRPFRLSPGLTLTCVVRLTLQLCFSSSLITSRLRLPQA